MVDNRNECLFRSILLLAADCSDELRASEVERLMADALDQGCFDEFRQWLLSQPLMEWTRQAILSYEN